MENLTLDYLPKYPNIKIYQHKKMFRINTDTSLLGEFLDFEPNLSVLDIGTNNGALLLYSSLLKPLNMVGIDINEEALKIADKNLLMNNINNYQLINCDITDYINNNQFDVIISNPPYFVSSDELKNKNEYLKMARHEEYLTLKNLIKAVKINLKETGKFYLIHRYIRLKEIQNELEENGLFINKEKLVYDENKKDPISILLKISFKKTEIIKEKITINR